MTIRSLCLTLALALLPCAAHAQNQAQAPAAPQQAKPVDPSPLAQEIIFAGKLYSPLKLSVTLPYTSQIMSMPVAIGQKVKKDDVLATFEIPLETRMSEKRTLSLASVKDLEHQLATTARDIDKLRVKRKELEVMEKQNMATSQALAQNAQEIDVLEKQRVAQQEKLAVEKEQAQQRLDLARDRFGPKANFGSLPSEGIIKAPVDGYVLWINPELRKGVKLARETELFQVGVLDPILIRAQVHEIEALRLKLGDQAKVVFDSIPGKEFTATVSRIPWAPLPTALQQPSYYEIELTLPNADYALKEGLKAQVTIIPKK
ncbi:efflux RND transporter periplasmic adaptor subunit [Fundidesulfovibrio terrae]|uniref:efflux RND transporter periplasmic adaptor subunit n=1 Tax=Fundidesulfovibrio terrae TaxID=2922866 RepID=UPI001FAF00A9|nr:efflux RND transporter periplasmic adaptor subunit [Fundidesulfovibrio terrae]